MELKFMPLTDIQFKELLTKKKAITDIQLQRAQELANQQHKSLEEVVVETKLLSGNDVGEIIAQYFGVPYNNLTKETIADDILHLVPHLVARKHGIIAFKKNKEGIHVAMNDPARLEMLHLLRKKTGEVIIPYYARYSDILAALTKFHDTPQEEFGEQIVKCLQELASQLPGQVSEEEAPIVRIVGLLLEYAYANKASDIHIEPREDKVDVRYRIDGILHDIVTLPINVHDLIVTRIKVMAKLRTDEHRAAQDGKLQFINRNEKVDVRVSIIPIVGGEKVVMRLLAKQGHGFALEDLGFNPSDLTILKKNIHKPWGMILATGPTGCGKTTTLYAILNILNTRQVNISTIEDPVEYDIGGLNQIQVNPRTNLTFAQGLRSILRQDPNIIMVGEIRDQETAQIAVNAALTGHLVLSTLHTNDAATTLPRLLDMDVEPFLIASTVNVAIGQRLVRTICPLCTKQVKLTFEEFPHELLGFLSDPFRKIVEKVTHVNIGSGCSECHDTGYKGRIGIHEVLEMDESIRSLIMKRANADQIRAQARINGMITLIEDGVQKVLTGITTLEEVLRVTKE